MQHVNTALITAMSDAGFQSRQIIFMSGHRSEMLKTYNRKSSQQKRSLSSCLSTITNPDRHLPSSFVCYVSSPGQFICVLCPVCELFAYT